MRGRLIGGMVRPDRGIGGTVVCPAEEELGTALTPALRRLEREDEEPRLECRRSRTGGVCGGTADCGAGGAEEIIGESGADERLNAPVREFVAPKLVEPVGKTTPR